MADPRTYGTPIGATGGKPITAGRPKAGPASSDVQSAYLKHMLAADKEFHSKAAPPVRGNSGGLGQMLAKGKPPVGRGGKQREAAITDTVDKMAR